MRPSVFLAGAAGVLVIGATVVLVVLAGSDDEEAATGPVVITVAFEEGQPFEAISTRVTEGAMVTWRVTSDSSGELHLHGYDLEAELKPGAEVLIEFIADQTGRFELEIEESETTLGFLEVHPR